MTQDFDEARRQAVAMGWADSPLDQRSYAAQCGISARTLREWVRRYGVTGRPAARARAIIDTAIAQLRALRAALDAEEACQVGGEAEGERHAGPEDPDPQPPAATVVEPVPVPTARFQWF